MRRLPQKERLLDEGEVDKTMEGVSLYLVFVVEASPFWCALDGRMLVLIAREALRILLRGCPKG